MLERKIILNAARSRRSFSPFYSKQTANTFSYRPLDPYIRKYKDVIIRSSRPARGLRNLDTPRSFHTTTASYRSARENSMGPKILLHGSGAIGTIYVYLLLKAGYDITAVCRSNYEAAKRDGFLIDSERYGKGIRIHPKVVRTPAEAASDGPFDYLLVTTKAIPDTETSKVIAPAVSKGRYVKLGMTCPFRFCC